MQPTATSQTVESPDVLHIGGFSDAVFDLLAVYAAQGSDAARWVARKGSIRLTGGAGTAPPRRKDAPRRERRERVREDGRG
ncbi:hypothetical protein AB4084_39160, partial [Lysobacter sp. 2RAB21]